MAEATVLATVKEMVGPSALYENPGRIILYTLLVIHV